MYKYIRQYTGPLRTLILDWSGTTADKYVIAPAIVFQEVFKEAKVPISMKEARLPMGLRKDLHIEAITQIPEVRERWVEHYGSAPTSSDVDRMFESFVPKQLAVLGKYTELLPGVVKTAKYFQREKQMKIGMTTGFTRPMVDVLLKDANKQGFYPDCTVAGDEVENGARPKPFMVYKNLDLLDAWPIQSVLKVDDTVGGVGEGLSAGCWTVGVSRWSNYMDVDSLEHEKQLSKEELEERNKASREILLKCGAHYVIDSIVELPRIVEHINCKLRNGETPRIQ